MHQNFFDGQQADFAELNSLNSAWKIFFGTATLNEFTKKVKLSACITHTHSTSEIYG